MNRLRKDEKGFTLPELIVAMAISSLVVTAATGATFQILNSGRASNYSVAYRQVQTAGYWVSQDALQARVVDPWPPGPGEEDPGFPLVLEWTDWDNNGYTITYTLEDMDSGDQKYLQRQESVNGTPTQTFPVGRYIFVDADHPGEPTNCSWDPDEKVLTFTVKAQVGQQAATRTYEVKPRPLG